MATITVTTQEALNKALTEDHDTIVINSPHGGWLTVKASGSATVEAYGSATVEASDSATVRAYKYVAVHLFSNHVTLTGGVVIDLTKLDLHSLTDWVDYHGATRTGDTITVYKAVDNDLYAGHQHTKTQYPIGATVTAPDWEATPTCGHGLHFGYTPTVARGYLPAAARFLECTIDASETVALHDKVKARSCVVVREVDINGDAVTA